MRMRMNKSSPLPNQDILLEEIDDYLVEEGCLVEEDYLVVVVVDQMTKLIKIELLRCTKQLFSYPLRM
jgi:hypothetical protein